MNCPECKITIENAARFCNGCGLLVDSTRTVEADSQITAVRTNHGPGRILDGKYELLERLGAGGMGTVFRARRLHIGDDVAVKILNKTLTTREEVIERFRREARACATLRHANIVTIYDYSESEAEALAYIVMELVPGRPLGEWLKRGNRLPLHRAASLMSQICSGVGAAHRRGIIHRDLKPDNIMVVPPSSDSEMETVKVVDFGIAKLRDLAGTRDLTETGIVIGTPYYMSPEQCRGDDLDARSDVYSLGVVFYEMIAGVRPFDAPTPTGVIAKQLSAPPPPLHQTLRIPPGVEAVLMSALAKDPQSRPADSIAFAQALMRAMQNSPVPAVREARPHNAGKALAATFAVVCLMALTTAFLVRRSSSVSQPVTSLSAVQTKQASFQSSPLAPARPTESLADARIGVVRARPNPAAIGGSKSAAARSSSPAVNVRPDRKALKDFVISTGAIARIPVIRTPRRMAVDNHSDQMPLEVRRLLKQLVQSGIPDRSAGGKVTTVYVTRPGN